VINFVDRMTVSGTRKREDGYLVVDARVARIGVQRYLGSEVGKPELPFVDVYRPPEEVFNPESMASFAHRPVTNDHPSVSVTSENWKKYAVGQTADEIRRDGDYLRVPLMVSDEASIADIESGKRELSAGYGCELEFVKGVTPEGQTYDAVQRNIRDNHVAIVKAGRAGKECRIGDGSSQTWGLSPITTQQKDEHPMSDTLRNMLVDGLPVATTDAGAIAIEKLIGDRKVLSDKIAEIQATFDATLAEKDAELAKRDAALDDAKSKILDQVAVDKLVADRVALEFVAKSIVKDVKTVGVTDADLRRAVVVAKHGEASVADKTPAYVDARFDILAESVNDSSRDQFRDTVRDGVKPTADNDVFAARQKAFDTLVNFDRTGTDGK
jgi:uncharacterized protein